MKLEKLFLGLAIPCALLALMLLQPNIASHSYASAQSNSISSNVPVTVPSGEFVRVYTPSGTNISLSSINGGYYQIANSVEGSLNVFQFVPSNSSMYTVILSITSNTSSYAYILTQPEEYIAPIKNITDSGNLLLTLSVNSTAAPASNGVWDPLFGLTGLKLQSVSFSFDNAIELLLALGFLIMALGLVFHSKISYLGAILLFFGAAMVLGFLVLFGLIIAYVVSFAAIAIVWRIRSRRIK